MAAGARRALALWAAGGAALLLILLARLPPPAHPPSPARLQATALVSSSNSPLPNATASVATRKPADKSADKAEDKPVLPPKEPSNAPAKEPGDAPALKPPEKPANKPEAKPTGKKVIYTKDLYTGGHLEAHAERCPALGARVQVLVLVTTAPAHRAAREAVRLTWGHAQQRSDVAMAFVIGRPPDHLTASLAAEDAIYGDLIVGDFVDSYSNLTLKALSMLQWAHVHCPRANFLLKTDDDMFINVPRLLRFVQAPARRNAVKTIYGRVLKKTHPRRAPKSKYYLPPEQFPQKVLPPFATGPAYLMTMDTPALLLAAAPERPYVRLEDVFVTGILADAVGARRQHAVEFYNKKISPHPCAVQRGVSFHMVSFREQFELWRRLLDNSTRCS